MLGRVEPVKLGGGKPFAREDHPLGLEGPTRRWACVTPPRIPTLISVSPKRAGSEQTTRSHEAARAISAPTAAALTAAMTGIAQS
jgi:hypothetical protein